MGSWPTWRMETGNTAAKTIPLHLLEESVSHRGPRTDSFLVGTQGTAPRLVPGSCAAGSTSTKVAYVRVLCSHGSRGVAGPILPPSSIRPCTCVGIALPPSFAGRQSANWRTTGGECAIWRWDGAENYRAGTAPAAGPPKRPKAGKDEPPRLSGFRARPCRPLVACWNTGRWPPGSMMVGAEPWRDRRAVATLANLLAPHPSIGRVVSSRSDALHPHPR